MKKITLLLFTIGIFTAFGFTVLQGGNDPVPGIDVIIKEAGIKETLATFSVDHRSLKELSDLKDEERSIYLSKYLTPILEKITKEKGLEQMILKGLLETRCVECNDYEVFDFKVSSKKSKKEYSITLNTKFDTKWITVITDRDNFEKPIANPHNFEGIDRVNEIEKQFLSTYPNGHSGTGKTLTASLLGKFKSNFYRIEGHQGLEYTSKEEVFDSYVGFVKKIIEADISMEKNSYNDGVYLKYFSIPRARKDNSNNKYKRTSERLKHKNRAILKKNKTVLMKEQ
ncbi:hypothetical protein [Nonlabens antarcticus]|uniref:hypothetical protein n=1 Tax=Nonlabens antarcticus TaxID=392714 RepID=UPI001890B813|nr:hypothetical protein [Nonlabens antarcticus]